MVVGSSPTPGASARALGRNSSGRGRRASVALGAASELEAVAALRRAGYHVSIPVLDGGSPYDCVVDDGRSLLRVQIKTGYVSRGSVWWACRSTSYHRNGGTTRDYVGVADLFAVWVPELSRCFLVPVRDCGRHQAALRLEPARNNQRKGVRLAAGYELGPSASGLPAVRECSATYRASSVEPTKGFAPGRTTVIFRAPPPPRDDLTP